jgi:hypothetical protein
VRTSNTSGAICEHAPVEAQTSKSTTTFMVTPFVVTELT